ncbi:NAD-dependent epimerase/dehydratase family protein [Pseudomonadales bacterium]|nr:NAD-dependent epimerase/dehydratase family protein [Pseudomonadales bacterium]
MTEKINVLQIGLGFIGGRYNKALDDRFVKYSIKRLESDSSPIVESPSKKKITLAQIPSKIQAIVVFAYSDKRKENFEILKNVFSLAAKLGVETIVYIGTSAIFEIKDGLTDENSSYLTYRESYADTKLKIRNALKKKAFSFDGSVIVLHPTIVFGHGGNWTRTVRNSLMCGTVLLPRGGEGLCNPVHVDDICQAVDLAVMCPSRAQFSEYLISSGITMPWRDVYEWERSQNTINNIECGRISNCEEMSLFHSSRIKNVVYHCLYSRLGAVLVRIIKCVIRKRSVSVAKESVQEYEKSNVYEPAGVYRMLHTKKQIFSIELARNELSFDPKFTSVDMILEMLSD